MSLSYSVTSLMADADAFSVFLETYKRTDAAALLTCYVEERSPSIEPALDGLGELVDKLRQVNSIIRLNTSNLLQGLETSSFPISGDSLKGFVQHLVSRTRPSDSAAAKSLRVPPSVEQAFCSDYLRPETSDRFHARFLEVCRDWTLHFDQRLCPSLGLLQSSGVGKSRLCRQLAERGVATMYLAFRPSNQAGYPLGTPFLQKYMAGQNTTRKLFFSFLALFYSILEVTFDLVHVLQNNNISWSCLELFDLMAGIARRSSLDRFSKIPSGDNSEENAQFLENSLEFFTDAGPCFQIPKASSKLEMFFARLDNGDYCVTFAHFWKAVFQQAEGNRKSLLGDSVAPPQYSSSQLLELTFLNASSSTSSSDVKRFQTAAEKTRLLLSAFSALLRTSQPCDFIPIAFVIDEVDNFAMDAFTFDDIDTPLRCLRYATRVFRPDRKETEISAGVCFIMLGTESSASTIAPSLAESNSFRKIVRDIENIPPPPVFWHLWTFNIFQHHVEELLHYSAKDALSSLIPFYCFGRPLWNTCESSHDLLDMATVKITKFHMLPEKSWNDLSSSLSCCAALLGVRITLDLSPRSEVVRDLVASYSRVVTHVSDDRSLLFTEYVPEPVLAWASARILSNVSFQNKVTALNRLRQGNHLEKGFAGKIFAQLVLVSAYEAFYDKSLEGQVVNSLRLSKIPFCNFWLHSVSMADFIDALLNPSRGADGQIASELRAAFPRHRVRLFSFTYVDEPVLTAETFPLFFAAGLGIASRKNSWYVDLVIPVLLDPELHLTPDNFSCIVIQVKNRTDENLPGLLADVHRIFSFASDKAASMKSKSFSKLLDPMLAIVLCLGFEYTRDLEKSVRLFPLHHDWLCSAYQASVAKKRAGMESDDSKRAKAISVVDYVERMELSPRRMLLTVIGLGSLNIPKLDDWIDSARVFLQDEPEFVQEDDYQRLLPFKFPSLSFL